jgi:hypothetical protein
VLLEHAGEPDDPRLEAQDPLEALIDELGGLGPHPHHVLDLARQRVADDALEVAPGIGRLVANSASENSQSPSIDSSLGLLLAIQT